ncbi:MAG: hypothetical protein LBB23_01695 [Rickettsiales bacterium]|jgi:hypothetical protein|nr:hypothetical protein [Rickettsiales bacterium]
MENLRFFHGTQEKLEVGDELIPQFKTHEDVNASIKIRQPMYIKARTLPKVALIDTFGHRPLYVFSSEINGEVYELENNDNWYFCGEDNECHYRNNAPVKVINKITFHLEDLSKIVDVYKVKDYKFGIKRLAEWRIKRAREKYGNMLMGFRDEKSEQKFFNVLNRYAIKINPDSEI